MVFLLIMSFMCHDFQLHEFMFIELYVIIFLENNLKSLSKNIMNISRKKWRKWERRPKSTIEWLT